MPHANPAATPASAFRPSGTALAALIVALASAATLAGAWFFQLVIGLAPCPLCLEQRIPYYVAIPVALMAAVAADQRRPTLARLLLGAAGVLMLAAAGLAIYHAGVEWHWWQGPTACSGAGPVQGGNLLTDLNAARVVRCDEAPWRLFGISLAGWNALIAATLAVVAFAGVAGRGARRGGVQ
ncbi:disulfide bond formation protein B [Bosea sp. 117]|uniref:disulfide bond formation protein B n=1 Tax=Bosea sp. 117 TaxID=1125973 RepID=UPI000494062B|nr:disulfide bond formation protein B [Bosea sp. 117]